MPYPEIRDAAEYHRQPGDRDVPRLSCSQLGGDCDFVAQGRTSEEVKRELLAHVADAHRVRAALMSVDEREALDVRIDQVLRRHAVRGW